MALKKIALNVARSRVGRPFLGLLFGPMSFLLPASRLRETDHLLAFFHPQPAYPTHILLVPRKAIADLSDLSADDAPFLLDLFAAVASLVDEFGLEQQGYRLIANGGPYQDVPRLHFHLVSEAAALNKR